MTVILRPFDEAVDYPRLVEISNTWNDEPTTEAREREEAAGRDGQGVYRYQTALRDSEPVGFCLTYATSWERPGDYHVWIRVDPAHRKTGIGSALYADALAWAKDWNVVSLKATTRDDDPASVAFMERRGFATEAHTFRSTLDFAAFDETPFTVAIAANEAAGIQFTNLAEIGYDAENQRKLYDLNMLLARGNPMAPDHVPPFEQFMEEIFHAPWFIPDGQIVARHGDRWIGIGAVGRFPDSDRAFNAFTGVHPDYRGRKIALALKLLGIRVARRVGAQAMWTNNDSRNAPMLAVNRKLGFVPERGLYRMRRTLTA